MSTQTSVRVPTRAAVARRLEEEAELVVAPQQAPTPGQALVAVGDHDPARVTVISEVLGEAILEDRIKVQAILHSQSEVSRCSLDVLHAALEIGRSIGSLRACLGDEDYRKLVEAAPRIWGTHLSRPMVTQLVTVAAAVDTHKLDLKSLPKSMSTIYQLATMTKEQLRLAREAGIYHTTVTRREVIRWKKSVLLIAGDAPVEADADANAPVRSKKSIRANMERLRTERRRLAGRMEAIERELGKLELALDGG